MSYANPDALVSTDWLAERLGDPSIRPIEVDEDTTLYAAGHIPGAVGWDWTNDLQHATQRDYQDKAGLAALLGGAGVGSGTTVVLYGGNNNWFAAYAYWLLKYRGFDAVKLLNGGRKKWELEGRELTDAPTEIEPADCEITGPDRPELRALRDHVLSSVGAATFVDVRSPEEFTGETMAPPHLPQEQPYVAGHVPGALNIPWVKSANDDGTFRSGEELRELYAGVGDGEVIAYCRIGERSSHTWFVLTELLGHENVRNYDGSWTEYGSMVAVPVETGG